MPSPYPDTVDALTNPTNGTTADASQMADAYNAIEAIEAEVGTTPTSTTASARYIRTSANYTTTSSTFVDVDATNMNLTITTRARRCLVGFTGSVEGSAAASCQFDVLLDGVRISTADYGITYVKFGTSNYRLNASFTFMTDVLSAASHTFKLQWRRGDGAGTVTLPGTATADMACSFWVQEIR